MLKHVSWNYEKEWRIVLFDEGLNGGLENFQVRPTSIYFGLNSSKEKIEHTKLILDNNIPFVKHNMKNNEFFDLVIYEEV